MQACKSQCKSTLQYCSLQTICGTSTTGFRLTGRARTELPEFTAVCARWCSSSTSLSALTTSVQVPASGWGCTGLLSAQQRQGLKHDYDACSKSLHYAAEVMIGKSRGCLAAVFLNNQAPERKDVMLLGWDYAHLSLQRQPWLTRI